MRSHYGAGPLHLLALLASFAIAGAAVVGWFGRPRDVVSVLVWFGAAIVIHDFVLLPLYSLLDRLAFAGWLTRPEQAQRPPREGPVNPVPYLRIPAILSGLLLAVFFPVIFGLGSQTELSASGIPESGYLARWLLATGVMFMASGLAYAVAIGRASRHRTGAEGSAGPPPSDQQPPTSESQSPAPDPQPPAPDPQPLAPDPQPLAPDPEMTATTPHPPTSDSVAPPAPPSKPA
jgi:hypothetical protein